MKLMKNKSDGHVEFYFESLAKSTSMEFSDKVRSELSTHLERGDEIDVLMFNVESKPGSGKTNIIKKFGANLLIRAGSICYNFSWWSFDRGSGNISQSTSVNWMFISAIKLFAEADQMKGC